MPKRIPHTEMEILTGAQTAEDYLAMQQRLRKYYLKFLDLIYSSYSLHHWKNPVRAIQNLYRALKNDGVMLIYDFQRHLLTYYLPFIRKGLLESIRASYTFHEISLMVESLELESFIVKSSFPYLSVMITK